MSRVYSVTYVNAIPGLDVIEIYNLPEQPENPVKPEIRRSWKRLLGILVMTIFAALLLSVTEVRATPWPPEPPAAPVPQNVSPSADAAAQAAATAAAKARSDAAAAARAKSTSGSQSDVFAPVTVGVTGGPASAATGPVQAAGGTSGAQAANGPINVAPSTVTQSRTTALALSLPAPVTAMASANNCLVAGAGGWAAGWNFFSTAGPQMLEAPVCNLRAMAAEADAACQFRSGYLLRQQAVKLVAPTVALPDPSETLQDLSPEQCLAARAPRIVMQAPPQTTVVTQIAQEQGQAQEASPTVTSPAATPLRAPTRQPKTTPMCSELPQCEGAKQPSLGDSIRR